MEYRERTYRNRVNATGFVSFQVRVKETDLWISADRPLEDESRDIVLGYRYQLEQYIKLNPEFLTTLNPYKSDAYAPEIVSEMINETKKVGVGPMASVAGAIAEFLGKRLLNLTNQVIVENGGDIYLKADRDIRISVFAGESPMSERIGIVIKKKQMPLGVCSSSGTVGHSLSLGTVDAACILSPSAVLADGMATALGNRIKSYHDMEKSVEWAGSIDGIVGILLIKGDKMAIWGDVELIGL